MSVKAVAARLEIGRIDWSAYRAPASGGPGIRDLLLGLLDAGDESEAVGCSLEYRFEVQSMVFEVALPAVGVILAAYAEDLPLWVEMELLNVLHNIITGEPHRSELELGNVDLVDKCIERARDGIWVMYSRLSKWNSDFLLDVLELVDSDRERFTAFRAGFILR